MTRDQYRAYLRSDHWRDIAKAAKALAGWRCRVCNNKTRLQVHHREYSRLGAELPSDLTVLCNTCHKLYHDSKRLPRPPRAKRKTV